MSLISVQYIPMSKRWMIGLEKWYFYTYKSWVFDSGNFLLLNLLFVKISLQKHDIVNNILAREGSLFLLYKTYHSIVDIFIWIIVITDVISSLLEKMKICYLNSLNDQKKKKQTTKKTMGLFWKSYLQLIHWSLQFFII